MTRTQSRDCDLDGRASIAAWVFPRRTLVTRSRAIRARAGPDDLQQHVWARPSCPIIPLA